jgi:AraC-like DNA-binding protein
MTAPLPHIHFDADLLPETSRFDIWRQGIVAFEVARAGDASLPFRAKIDAWSLGDLVMTSGPQSAVRFVRTAERVRADAQDGYLFALLRQGSWTGDADGAALTVGAGQLVVFDLARPAAVETSDVDSVTAVIPRAAIGSEAAESRQIHGCVLDGAAGRLLADHFLSLARYLPMMDGTMALTIYDATTSLIAANFAALSRSEEVGESNSVVATRHAVRRYINDNLTAPDLSPNKICADLKIGRSALYRAFAPLGGVVGYIQGRRLDAVHALLADSKERRTITEIAYSFNFASIPHFSKVYRSRFGCRPSETRAEPDLRFDKKDPSKNLGKDGPTLFGEWVEKVTKR